MKAFKYSILFIILIFSFSLSIYIFIEVVKFKNIINETKHGKPQKQEIHLEKIGVTRVKLYLKGRNFLHLGMVFLEFEKNALIDKTLLHTSIDVKAILHFEKEKDFICQLAFNKYSSSSKYLIFYSDLSIRTIPLEIEIRVIKPITELSGKKQYIYAKYSICGCVEGSMYIIFIIFSILGIIFILTLFLLILYHKKNMQKTLNKKII